MGSVEPAGSLLLGQGKEEGEGEVVTNTEGDGGDGGEAGADAAAESAAESAAASQPAAKKEEVLLAEGAAKKSDNILNQLGELPDASPDLIKQLKNLKELYNLVIVATMK